METTSSLRKQTRTIIKQSTLAPQAASAHQVEGRGSLQSQHSNESLSSYSNGTACDAAEEDVHSAASSGRYDEHNREGRQLMRTSMSTSQKAREMLDALDWTYGGTRVLYDRQDQKRMLEQAFERSCSASAKREFVLITGPSGVGKTCLAQQLRTDQVFFLSIKFDQFRRNEPFSILQVFDDFVQILQGRSDNELFEFYQLKLQQSFDCVTDRRVLTDLIPSLAQLFGDEPDNLSLSGRTISSFSNGDDQLSSMKHTQRSEFQKRFLQNFVRLLQTISSPEMPVILFMDDLQWSDSGSLDIVKTIYQHESNAQKLQQNAGHSPRHDTAQSNSIPGFFLLGACRSDEVAFNSPLSCLLRELEDIHRIVINEIRVSNMKTSAINEMLSNVLQLAKPLSRPLAEILCQYTKGNIFFVVQFLKSLYEDDLLYVDAQTHDWIWDPEEIREALSGMDVVKLLSQRIQALPQDAQEVLKVAACLGPEIDEDLLYSIVDADVTDAIMISVEEGIVVIDEEGVGGTAAPPRPPKFLHDQMQQAAYSLITDKSAFHAHIGQILKSTLSTFEASHTNEYLFLIVDQLRLGLTTIQHDEKERIDLVNLSLLAGRKAIATSAFRTGAEYFEFGINLLNHTGRRSTLRSTSSSTCDNACSFAWKKNYDLCLALYNAAAEAEYVLANFERMDMLINCVLSNARDFGDQLQAQSTRVYALGARNNLQEAIDCGFEILRRQGISLPRKARTINIALSLANIKSKLSNMTDENILSLPTMMDPDSLAAMKMLTLLSCYTILAREEYAPLIALQQIQLTLKQGMSGMSASAFAVYGMLQMGALGNTDVGNRYGQLALRIVDKYDATEWLPRVYVAYFGVIKLALDPVWTTLEHLQYAQMVAMETGDIEFAMFNGNLYCINMLYSGRPLPDVMKAMDALYHQQLEYKQDTMLTLLGPRYQQVLNFMGLSVDPLILTGQIQDEEDFIEQAAGVKNSTALLLIHQCRAELGYYMQDYSFAREAIRQARDATKDTIQSYGSTLTYFYEALILLALARENANKKRKYKQAARQNYKLLQKYQRSCSHNYENKLHLIDAEFIVTDGGNIDKALDHYKESINAAHSAGFLHEQALACERCALALDRVDRGRKLLGGSNKKTGKKRNSTSNVRLGANRREVMSDRAQEHIDKALELYQLWGAQIKLSQLASSDKEKSTQTGDTMTYYSNAS